MMFVLTPSSRICSNNSNASSHIPLEAYPEIMEFHENASLLGNLLNSSRATSISPHFPYMEISAFWTHKDIPQLSAKMDLWISLPKARSACSPHALSTDG
uniref:Uncharacterized protein n=1 Tax=Opuntia streptacantha TaxID=393608 RepID=A0A7C8Z749_OPUST